MSYESMSLCELERVRKSLGFHLFTWASAGDNAARVEGEFAGRHVIGRAAHETTPQRALARALTVATSGEGHGDA